MIERLEPARAKAIEMGLPCSEIVHSRSNGYVSFLIAPDGSKEGWEASNAGEKQRAEWIAWSREGYRGIDWAHVAFGGDDPQFASLSDHNAKGEE
jgi:hypothetical protein